jgi:ribosomal protein L30
LILTFCLRSEFDLSAFILSFIISQYVHSKFDFKYRFAFFIFCNFWFCEFLVLSVNSIYHYYTMVKSLKCALCIDIFISCDVDLYLMLFWLQFEDMNAFKAYKACVPIAYSPNLYITLVRGIPGTRKQHRRTLEALRLGKCNRTVMRWNTPTVRGMIQQVSTHALSNPFWKDLYLFVY